MKIIIIIATMLVTLSFYAHAQKNDYLAGYIVKLSNDTLQGYIYNGSDYQNSRSIRFKSQSEQPNYLTYSPDSITAYSLGSNKFYLSKNVKIRDKYYMLFLRQAVTGYANLYYAKDESREDIFFLEKNKGEIIYIQKNIMLSILGAYLSDCKEMIFNQPAAAKKYKYQLSSLTQTINTYNQCIRPNETRSIEMKPTKLIVTKGVLIGGNSSNLSYYIKEGTYHNADFASKVGFVSGFYLNFPVSKSFAIRPELIFTTKGASLQQPSTTTLYNQKVDFTISYLQVPVLLRYKIRTRKIEPFINAGPSISYAILKKAESKLISTTNSSEINTTTINLDNYAMGYIIGIGAEKSISKRNIFGIEARLDKNFTNLSYKSNRISLTSLQVLLGLSF